MEVTDDTGTERRPEAFLATAVLAGAAVAIFFGVYGQVHDPASETTISLFFSTTLHFKAWTTTVVLILALAQVLTALWLYGRFGSAPAPSWVGPTHRVTGLLALVASLPVAYHCLWALGFESDMAETRRFWHSVMGCAFYGAFVTKIIVVKSKRMPGWALPAIGGLTFTVLALVWLTSSLWFFDTIGLEW